MRKRNMERIALEDLGVAGGAGGFVGLPQMPKEGEDRLLGSASARRTRNLPNIGEVWYDAHHHHAHTAHTALPAHSILAPPTRRKAKALEQGLLQDLEPAAAPLEPISDRSYPPVIRQALDHMASLGPEVILFTRVGGFYELYFSHAEQWAGRLDLKLASKKTLAGSVPMAGFPFWQLEKYLKILVQDEGCYVAICEEYPREHHQAGDVALEAERGNFERKIARVVTPGTLIDEEWIEQGENHFLLALERLGEEVGLAWADIGTGEVFVTACGADQLAAEVARIGPREIVCTDHEREGLLKLRERAAWVVSSHEIQSQGRVAEVLLDTAEDAAKLHALKTLELLAAERLLDYVGSRMPGIEVKMQAPIRRDSNEVMGIDVNSMRGLEIKNTLRDGGTKGSLLHTVNRTVTRGGRRLLGNWLSMYFHECREL
jgi:DNA mismatch repair ATPase MutS